MSAQVDITKNGVKVSLAWMNNLLIYGNISFTLNYAGAPVTAAYGGFRATDDLAIIADQNSNNCFLFSRATGQLTNLGPKAGTNNVGFTRDGIPVWQNSPTTYRIGNNQYTIPSPPTTPSNGFLDVDENNNPVWTALNEIKVIQGINFYNWNTSPNGEWTVGLSDIFYGIIAYRKSTNQFFKVYEANVTYTIPRINDLGIAAIGLPGIFVSYDQFVPLNTLEINDMIKPFPNPLWLASYFSHSLRPDYGDNPNYSGNAILVAETENGVANVARLAALGKPLIINPDNFHPSAASLIVAYYLHTASVDEMRNKVELIESKINEGHLPENPIIVYYDHRKWPNPLPSFLNKDRHWLSPQAYRNKGESLNLFNQSIVDEFKRLGDAGFTLIPTLMFYTRNGELTEQEVLETFPLIRTWFDIWLDSNEFISIIGLLSFADRRPTGMVTYPSFEQYWNRLTFLNLEVPSRFSNWIPRKSSEDKVLEQILSQSRTSVVLSKLRKDYLKSKLNPFDPPPSGGIPSDEEILKVVKESKNYLENKGVKFWKKEDVDKYYAEHLDIPEEVKRDAMSITLLTAWELSKKYSEIGLERYEGKSGVDVNGTKLSFDIIFLTKQGPSVDILAGGVEPAVMKSTNINPNDWVAPINPNVYPPFPR